MICLITSVILNSPFQKTRNLHLIGFSVSFNQSSAAISAVFIIRGREKSVTVNKIFIVCDRFESLSANYNNNQEKTKVNLTAERMN